MRNDNDINEVAKSMIPYIKNSALSPPVLPPLVLSSGWLPPMALSSPLIPSIHRPSVSEPRLDSLGLDRMSSRPPARLVRSAPRLEAPLDLTTSGVHPLYRNFKKEQNDRNLKKDMKSKKEPEEDMKSKKEPEEDRALKKELEDWKNSPDPCRGSCNVRNENKNNDKWLFDYQGGKSRKRRRSTKRRRFTKRRRPTKRRPIKRRPTKRRR